MNVIGIVVEYNPFHNGHLYQINKIKELYPDSIIIVAMSTHFTQRGDVSVLDKWNKTKIALDNNIDMVLEIPFVFSNSSADTFSYASLRMLNELNIDILIFGSESNDIDMLKKCAKVQVNNDAFDNKLKEYISKGYNYPTSISKCINDLCNISIKDSNDLLGVSYIKEIIKNKYNIKPISIKRTNNFLDIESNDSIISANNIREKLKNNIVIDKYVPKDVTKLIHMIDENKLFELLKYKIISEKDNLCNYHLVTEGIEKRIFVGFTKDDASKYKNLEYIRVLGMSEKGKIYLNKRKKETSLPIITKFQQYPMLELELKASLIYGILINDNTIYDKEVKNFVIIK